MHQQGKKSSDASLFLGSPQGDIASGCGFIDLLLNGFGQASDFNYGFLALSNMSRASNTINVWGSKRAVPQVYSE